MSALKFAVIVGSVREGRIGERVAKLFMSQASNYKAKGYTFELIDAEEANLPMLKKPIHFYQDPSTAPENLQKLNKIIEGADGYFFISAEYNRLPCPGLLNLIDHFPVKAYAGKPVGIIAYSMGPYAGCSAAASLPNYIAELGAIPVKQAVRIPVAHRAITEAGATEDEHITSSMDKVVNQVAWFADACKTKREKDGAIPL